MKRIFCQDPDCALCAHSVAVGHITISEEQADGLRQASTYLGKIRAFGNTIGPDVSKVQIGCAHNIVKAIIA
jgi:hypothetical protein